MPISLLLDRLTSSSLAFPHRSCLVKLLSPPPKLLVACMQLITESEGASPKCGLFLLMSWVSIEFRSSRVMFDVNN